MRIRFTGWTVDKPDSAWSWLTLLSSTLLMTTTFGFLCNFGIFYARFLAEYKDTREKTAWVSSIPLCIMNSLALLGTWIATRYGLRKATIFAAFLLGGSFLATSYAENVNQLFGTFSVPFGFASCILIMVSNISNFTYFDKRFPIANGLLTGGAAVMQVGMTYIYIYLLDNYGMKTTLQLVGAVNFATCVLAAITYLPTKYSTAVKNDEEDRRHIQKYLSLFKSKKYLLLLLVNLVDCFAYAVSSVHQVQLGLEMGISANICNQFPVFSSVSNGIGRIFCGTVLNFYVTNKLMYYQGSLFFAGLTALLGLLIRTTPPFIAFVWIYAFLDGNLQAIGVVILRLINGKSTLAEGYSVILMSCGIPIMLGPPITGLIVDKTNSYSAFFYVAGTPHLIACCIAHGIRYAKAYDNEDKEVNKRLNNSEIKATDSDYDIKGTNELLCLETSV